MRFLDSRLILVLASFVSATFVGAATFDRLTFTRLDPHEQLLFVTSRVQERDTALLNFSVELHEFDKSRLKPDAAFKTVSDQQLQLRRLGNRLFLHCHESAVIPTDFTVTWDGAVSCSYTKRLAKVTGSGRIVGKEPDFFRNLPSAMLLGIRADRTPATLADWIQKITETSPPQSIAVHDVQGKPQVILEIQMRGGIRYSLSFAAAQDFAPVHFEYVHAAGGNKTSVVADATLAQVNGFWVPTRVEHQTVMLGSDGDYAEELSETQVSNWKIGHVRMKDLAVEFPRGTVVLDAVKHRAYRVSANGTEEDLDLYDARLGKIVHPSTTQTSTSPAR